MADDPRKTKDEEKEQKTNSTEEKPVEDKIKDSTKEPEKKEKEKTEGKKEENKPEDGKEEKIEKKKEEPKKEKKEEKKPEPKKLSKKEKKDIELDKKNTEPDVMELVEEIKEVAEELEEINKHPDLKEVKTEKEEKEEDKKEQVKETKKVDNGGEGTEAIDKKEDKGEEEKAETQEDIESEAEKPEEKSEEDQKDSEEKKDDEKPEEKVEGNKEEAEEEEKEAEKQEEPESKEEKKEDDEQQEEQKEPKKSFFAKIFKKKPKKELEEKKEDEEKKPKKSKKKLIIILVIVLIPVLFIGVTALLAMPVYKNGMKTAALGQEAVAILKSQNLPEAEKKLGEVKESLVTTQNSYKKIAYLKIFPFLGKYIKDGDSAFNAALAGVEAGELALSTINPYSDVLGFQGEGSFQGGTTEERIAKILETLGEITPNLEQVSQKLDVVNQEFANIDPNDYPETFKDKEIRANILKAQDMISEASVILAEAQPMINVLPQIMGYPDTQKYMILFQNDGELRATGGFLSAYSLVNVEKGKVIPESSNDIYHLDDQFSESLEPPIFIQEHLNEKRWYLRNMNTSPDFKVSMDQFKTNYETISGAAELNGVIAIDSYVLEQIIEILGPVEVPGYGTFTSEMDDRCNFSQVVCELEHIIDKPLATVASNRKADILGPMMSAILSKIFEGDNAQIARLAPLLFDLLEQKHVLTYFSDETSQAAAEAFNIAGRIEAFDGDYLHINDSNFGGAKTNFYIDQEVNQKIEIADDGTIKKTLEISYTHTEPGDNCNLEAGELCLSGIQRNYFRVYVPEGAVLEQGLGSQVEITTGQELGKTYFDGFFELRPESKAKVMLVYTLPFKAEGGNYNLLVQKQAGTQTVKHLVDLNGAQQELSIDQDTELDLTY